MHTDKSKGIPYQNIVYLEVAFEVVGFIMTILEKLNRDKYEQAKKIYSSLSIFDPINTKNVLDFFSPICRKIKSGEMSLEYFAENIDIDFKPKISIIVPVYNVSPYLARALNSVVNQTLHDIEIICVDDASTDNSLSILEDFAKIDNRIKVLKHDKNLGVSCARNTGLKVAKADYFMFLDPDDWYELTICEKMYNKIHNNEYDVAVCNVAITISDDMNGQNRGYTNERNYATINVSWVWNKIFKRKIIEKYQIKFPDGLLGEDAYFKNCYYAVSNRKVGIIDEKLYNYFVRKDSLMKAFDSLDNPEVFDCFSIGELTYNFYKEHDCLGEAYQHYFKSMGLGIKFLSEKNYDKAVEIICNSLKQKGEIKVGDKSFFANGKEYTINNDIVFSLVVLGLRAQYQRISKPQFKRNL